MTTAEIRTGDTPTSRLTAGHKAGLVLAALAWTVIVAVIAAYSVISGVGFLGTPDAAQAAESQRWQIAAVVAAFLPLLALIGRPGTAHDAGVFFCAVTLTVELSVVVGLVVASAVV